MMPGCYLPYSPLRSDGTRNFFLSILGRSERGFRSTMTYSMRTSHYHNHLLTKNGTACDDLLLSGQTPLGSLEQLSAYEGLVSQHGSVLSNNNNSLIQRTTTVAVHLLHLQSKYVAYTLPQYWSEMMYSVSWYIDL